MLLSLISINTFAQFIRDGDTVKTLRPTTDWFKIPKLVWMGTIKDSIDTKKRKDDTTGNVGWTPLWKLGGYLPFRTFGNGANADTNELISKLGLGNVSKIQDSTRIAMVDKANTFTNTNLFNGKINSFNSYSPVVNNEYLVYADTVGAIKTTSYDAFGIIFQFPSGKMGIMYRVGASHVSAGDYGVIVIRTSTDLGHTWSNTTTVYSLAGVDCRNSGGGVTPDGRLVFFFSKYNPDTDTWLGVYYTYSEDEGVTWTTPTQITTTPATTDINPYGGMILIDNGKLMQSWYGNDGTNYFTKVIFSTDNGKTWGSTATVATSTTSHYSEITTAYLGGGWIIGLQRVDNGNYYNQVKSSDNGATWLNQGLVTFDSLANSPAWLSVIEGIDGRRQVLAYYGNRGTGKIRVIQGLGKDLIGDGVSAWDASTIENIATMTTNNGGYVSTINPHHGARALGWFYDRMVSASVANVTFFNYDANRIYGNTVTAFPLNIQNTGKPLVKFSMKNTKGYISFTNGANTVTRFQPRIYCKEDGDSLVSSSTLALDFVAEVDRDSTGMMPALSFDGRNTSSALSMRPIVGIGSYIGTINDYPFIMYANSSWRMGKNYTQTAQLSLVNSSNSSWLLKAVSGTNVFRFGVDSSADVDVNNSGSTTGLLALKINARQNLLEAYNQGNSTNDIWRFDTTTAQYMTGYSNQPIIYFRRSAGTSTVQKATGSGSNLGVMAFQGNTGSGWTATKAQIIVQAINTWSGTDNGNFMQFETTPSTTLSRKVDFIIDNTSASRPQVTVGATSGTGTGKFFAGDSLYIGTTLVLDASRNATLGIVSTGGNTVEVAYGVPNVIDSVEITTTAAVPTTNFNGTSGAHEYKVYGNITVTSGSALGAITITIGATDAVGAYTITPIASFAATGTGRTYFSPIPIRTASGAITYATTVVGTPTYILTLTAEKVW